MPNAKLILITAALAALVAVPGQAQMTDRLLKIGVLTDLSGPYADASGKGSVYAAEVAAADEGGRLGDTPIEILSADHQNKPDIASTLARKWFDLDRVDAIVDLPVTAVAYGVQQLAKERSKTVMITAAASSDFTAKACSPTSTHWADDTHALTAGTAKALVQQGGRTWYFITVDHAFGAALQAEATAIVQSSGGQVLGTSRFPLGNADYSSFLLQAQASGADVVALAAVGDDFTKAIKQAHEFGLGQGKPTLTGFLTYITDIKSLGLETAQNLTFSASFYWDQDDESRAFAKRYFDKIGLMPTKNQALIYTAVRHYIKAARHAGTDEAVAVNKAMRDMPVAYFGKAAKVREDGRVLFDLTLFRTKTPSESKAPWDFYQPIRTVPQREAFLPMNPACKS